MASLGGDSLPRKAAAPGYINALDYGISAGAVDNAAALQIAISYAIANNRALYIPAGATPYKFTPPLLVTGPLRIFGDGALALFGSLSTPTVGRDAINIPTTAPYFSGTVLSAVSNGKNIFECSGAGGYAFSVEDMAFTFQTLFVNTGHLVDWQPASGNAGPDLGMMGASWRNVSLYGHDGNHYMFNLTNMLYNTFDHCESFGGGHCNIYSSTDQCGNSVFIHPVAQVICGGSAHGYSFSANGNGVSTQLITLVRPQCITNPQPAQDGITPSAPTNTQKLMTFDANCHQISIIGPDMESPVGSYSTLPRDTTFIDLASGGMGTGYNFAAQKSFALDYLQGMSFVQSGSVTASGTTGTVTFPKQYFNSTPIVVLTGVGISAQLTSAPTGTGFAYTLSAAGTFNWMAIGG